MPFNYSIPLTASQKEDIQERLLSWGAKNYRPYPWREKGASAYKLLLAEILLRKTRADSVVSVYHEFLGRYPDISVLSTASVSTLERILRPLGLFRIRAKALKKMATEVLEKYGGQIPCDEEAIRSLPHCGRYTANAVLCFHYGKHTAIVDRNIERFLCRHFGFEPVVELHKADHMWGFMQSLLPEGRAKEFNYALLDYCALVCTSRKCLCGAELGNVVK